MKIKFLIPVIFILCGTASVFAQSEKVGDRLHKLFILCFTDNYKDASKYIVYRGSDTSRIWKDVYNYENEDEKNDDDEESKDDNEETPMKKTAKRTRTTTPKASKTITT